jgi:hypothetical protein
LPRFYLKAIQITKSHQLPQKEQELIRGHAIALPIVKAIRLQYFIIIIVFPEALHMEGVIA